FSRDWSSDVCSSDLYAGNVASTISHYYTTLIGRPVDIIFLHMLGFYIFAIVLGMRPLVGMIGAVAMAFASYEIIVIQAGHNAKRSEERRVGKECRDR